MNFVIKNKTIMMGALSFICFFLFYGISSRSELQVSDEVATFATGISLATRGDLVIDELQWLQDRVNIGQRGRKGHLYAKYFPGNVFCTTMIYKLTEKQNDRPYTWNHQRLAPSVTGARIVMQLNVLMGALAMMALFLVLSRFFNWRIAIITTLLVGLCSDWWYQSRGFFSEVGAGALLMTCLYFSTDDRPYLSSLVLAISILFRPPNLLGLPIWGMAFFKRGLKAIKTGILIIISLLILGFYNWLRFETPLDFGYGEEQFSSSILKGLYGILLSPGRSIFIYSPILILAIPGAWLFYQKERRLTITCLFSVIGYLLIIASWHNWDGGWSWGSRLLTPIVPLLGFLIAPVIDKARSQKWLMGIIVFFAVAGIGIQILSLARDPLKVMIEYVANGNIKYDETLYTLHNSWIAMQFRSLNQWEWHSLDSYLLRILISYCIQ